MFLRSFSRLTCKSNSRTFSTVTVTKGKIGTPEWRLDIVKNGRVISAWHDLSISPSPSSSPLRERTFSGRFNGLNEVTNAFEYVTYVNEIPKGTLAKVEMSTSSIGNSFLQDRKVKGGVVTLRNFKYGNGNGIPFNYGFIPQTWENADKVDTVTGLVGDNDPVDVVELSGSPLPYGAVCDIRILGALCMVDEGETDWKIIGLSTAHPLFKHFVKPISAYGVNDVLEKQINYHFPGVLATIRDWFINYKVPDGKGQNRFALDGALLSPLAAGTVVGDCHAEWRSLLSSTDMLRVSRRNEAGDYLWLPYSARTVKPIQAPIAAMSVKHALQTPNVTNTHLSE